MTEGGQLEFLFAFGEQRYNRAVQSGLEIVGHR
jgi:hypothetical protein